MSVKGQRLIFDPKTGKFVPGKAAPWQPPEQLRGLPSSWVTKDTSDPDRIHELDAPHIVEALKFEHQKQEQTPAKETEESVFADIDVWGGPFDQTHIDWIRFKAIRNLVKGALIYAQRGARYPLRKTRHLWFPKAKLDPRELREGRPPLPRDRPRHLRDKDLIVDVFSWPPRVVDELRARGIAVPDPEKLEREMNEAMTVTLQ